MQCFQTKFFENVRFESASTKIRKHDMSRQEMRPNIISVHNYHDNDVVDENDVMEDIA